MWETGETDGRLTNCSGWVGGEGWREEKKEEEEGEA